MRGSRRRVALAAALVVTAARAYVGTDERPFAPAACESLASHTLTKTRVTLATAVPEGSFTPPGATTALSGLPAFCRIAATLTPTTDSDIRIEVWLPASGWNGKFQAVGNGGWSGAIAFGAMAAALRGGYATASTDTGHSGGSASFALGHPEKLVDFGYRAVHEMTVAAKSLVAAYYGNQPTYSYWRGCSAGGRQGLKEAQRFPADYDGIIAGAPALDWTGRAASSMRVTHVLHKNDASDIPAGKHTLIHDAVLKACDTLDGVADGVLENPRRCAFDPQVLECKGTDTTSCLTAAQVESARQIYASPPNARTGRPISGLERGSELWWAIWGGPRPFEIGLDHFRYVVARDPSWTPQSFDFSRDAGLAEEMDHNTVNALDPNLRPFFERGGKLIHYHGWNDGQIAPGSSVQYYENVAETMGGASRISQSYRLFMVPGMAHCGGGDGTSTFDVMGALERWVEKGTPPDRIEASRVRNGTTDRTRPLCPYPQVATYRGTGSTNESSSFTCAAGSAVQERPQAAASIEGLDHIPIAVNDLERAADLYRSLGFALKPGRPHDNGIRNVHAKFADGTELELITAPAARDALTRTYRNHLAKGDGPAFLAFYARSVDRAEERLAGLPYIFFGPRNQAPTDRPEHFAHANTATSLIGVWLAADDFSRERRLLQDLGATIREQDVQTPDPIRTAVALVPDGRVLLLPATRQRVPGRRVIGATLRVTSLSAARDVLSKAPAPVPRALRETGTSLFLPPEVTHGLWLELCECR